MRQSWLDQYDCSSSRCRVPARKSDFWCELLIRITGAATCHAGMPKKSTFQAKFTTPAFHILMASFTAFKASRYDRWSQIGCLYGLTVCMVSRLGSRGGDESRILLRIGLGPRIFWAVAFETGLGDDSRILLRMGLASRIFRAIACEVGGKLGTGLIKSFEFDSLSLTVFIVILSVSRIFFIITSASLSKS